MMFFFGLNSIADLNRAHLLDINFKIFQLSQLNFKNILYIVSPIMAQGLYVLPGFGQRPFLVRRPNWENEEDWASIWGFLPSTHIADDWLGEERRFNSVTVEDGVKRHCLPFSQTSL